MDWFGREIVKYETKHTQDLRAHSLVGTESSPTPSTSFKRPRTPRGTAQNGQAELWKTMICLSGGEAFSTAHLGEVNRLKNLNALSQDLLDQVDRDIPRTYPTFPALQLDTFKQTLRRLLIAIATAYPAIGYVQGMNFVAAFLLIQCKDEDLALYLFRSLLEHRKYNLHDVYRKGLPKILKLTETLQQLLSIRHPTVYHHFRSIGMDPIYFTQNWIVTLFAYNSPFDVLIQLWNRFFSHGWEVFFRVCIVTVSLLEARLVKSNFEECARAIRDFEKDLPKNICEMADNIEFSSQEKAIMLEADHFLFSFSSNKTHLEAPETKVEYKTAIALAGTRKDLA